MENHHDQKVKGEKMRSQVVMPDHIEEPELNVGGTKEYRRNAILMITGGAAILGFVVVAFVFSGRLFYILPIPGFYLIGLGLKRYLESKGAFERDKAQTE